MLQLAINPYDEPALDSTQTALIRLAKHPGFPADHPGDPVRFCGGDLQRGCCRVEVPLQERVEFFDSELPFCHAPQYQPNPEGLPAT